MKNGRQCTGSRYVRYVDALWLMDIARYLCYRGKKFSSRNSISTAMSEVRDSSLPDFPAKTVRIDTVKPSIELGKFGSGGDAAGTGTGLECCHGDIPPKYKIRPLGKLPRGLHCYSIYAEDGGNRKTGCRRAFIYRVSRWHIIYTAVLQIEFLVTIFIIFSLHSIRTSWK